MRGWGVDLKMGWGVDLKRSWGVDLEMVWGSINKGFCKGNYSA